MSGALSLWLLSLSREQRESDSAGGPKPEVSAHSVSAVITEVQHPILPVRYQANPILMKREEPQKGSKRSTLLVTALLFGLLVVRHEPPLLVHLTVGQGVLLTLVGVLAALVLDADLRVDQLEHTAIGVLEIARVVFGYRIDLFEVIHD